MILKIKDQKIQKNYSKYRLEFAIALGILYITDRLSMINSVEARTPFLDNEMLQYHSKLNPKFNGTIINSKKLLKDIANI